MGRYISIIFLLAFLYGCAAPTPPFAVNALDKSVALQIEDRRPAFENQSETFTHLITNEAYGTSRVGIETFVPSPLRLFQHRLFEHFSKRASPPSVTVRHFAIYRNMEAFGKGVAGGAAAGAVGAIVLSKERAGEPMGTVHKTLTIDEFKSLSTPEWRLATFAAQENPSKAICYIVYIDAEIEGRRLITKTLVPTKLDEFNTVMPKAVEAAVQYYLSQQPN